jgi:hypothetical protein
MGHFDPLNTAWENKCNGLELIISRQNDEIKRQAEMIASQHDWELLAADEIKRFQMEIRRLEEKMKHFQKVEAAAFSYIYLFDHGLPGAVEAYQKLKETI